MHERYINEAEPIKPFEILVERKFPLLAIRNQDGLEVVIATGVDFRVDTQEKAIRYRPILRLAAYSSEAKRFYNLFATYELGVTTEEFESSLRKNLDTLEQGLRLFPNAGTWMDLLWNGDRISLAWTDDPGIYTFEYKQGDKVCLTDRGPIFWIALQVTYCWAVGKKMG